MARRDIAPYTAMLADPGTARFITVDGKPVDDDMTGWRHAVVMAGHWALHGAGMFVVEEKSTRQIRRTGRAVVAAGLAGFEVGWGIAQEFRGKGYAVEAARASIDWAFATFEIDADRPLHRSRKHRVTRRGAAARAPERHREIELFGHVADVWVTRSRGRMRSELRSPQIRIISGTIPARRT